MLLDSEHLLSKEAEREKRPVLYDDKDIERVMASGVALIITSRLRLEISQSIFSTLATSSVRRSCACKQKGRLLCFLAILATRRRRLSSRPKHKAADYCLIESTYGDRVTRTSMTPRDARGRREDTVKAGGTLMIPTFAMERTQELLYHLHQLFQEGRIPRVPVFIDSPLAIKLTAVYKKHESYFNPRHVISRQRATTF